MTIRNGLYTEYNNEDLLLFTIRSEVPKKKDDQLYRICYDGMQEPNPRGFFLDPLSGLLCMTVKANEISNAFSIQTYGRLGEMIVKVFKYKSEPGSLFITSTEGKAEDECLFSNMGDYYAKVVMPEQLIEIWEEYAAVEQFNFTKKERKRIVK